MYGVSKVIDPACARLFPLPVCVSSSRPYIYIYIYTSSFLSITSAFLLFFLFYHILLHNRYVACLFCYYLLEFLDLFIQIAVFDGQFRVLVDHFTELVFL